MNKKILINLISVTFLFSNIFSLFLNCLFNFALIFCLLSSLSLAFIEWHGDNELAIENTAKYHYTRLSPWRTRLTFSPCLHKNETIIRILVRSLTPSRQLVCI